MANGPQMQFTEKAQEALLGGQNATRERRLAQFEPETLLLSLLEQEDGVVPQILLKLQIDPATARTETDGLLAKAPTLQYAADSVAVSSRLRTVLTKAEQEARQFGDEFVSTEHLLLGILGGGDSEAARMLVRLGATRERVFQALSQIRKGHRVTDANPEGKYQALEKYGRDLTELAARQAGPGHRPRR
jgi:ATP-dependent Clp protease ATP-binding subunit ClpB